jgi:ribosomal protein RSM22 (predicted rRNA methylase)
MKGSWQIGMGMVTMQICEPSAEVLKWATNKTVEAKDKRAEKYGDKIENAVKFYQPSLKDKKWLTAFSWATDAGRRMVS